MRELLEPKSLRLVVKKSTSKRERYWTKHGGKPTVRRSKRAGMQRRLTRTSVLSRIASLSSLSLTNAHDKLAVAILNQRMSGALNRLKRQDSWRLSIPPKLEQASQASAFKSQEEKRKRE